jgi:mRNA-degrading endonuclease YafQ of YafQ-DinJ toxin-antitoxin module
MAAEDIIAAVELLAETGMLPEAYRPHKLSGEWKGEMAKRQGPSYPV